MSTCKTPETATMQGPAISCLCVTRRRPALLARAVDCFRRQTYEPRELIILHEPDDAATEALLATLNDATVRPMEAPRPSLPLGALRNLAVEAARGEYLAQWDDDDWYAPERLAAQVEAIRQSGKPACVLRRWTLFDAANGAAYLSQHRPWEGSLVARRDELPTYPALPRQEDTPVIQQLLIERKLVLLDRPDLYVYVYHGGNTWPRSHFEDNLVRYSQPLPAAESRRIAELLQTDLTQATWAWSNG